MGTVYVLSIGRDGIGLGSKAEICKFEELLLGLCPDVILEWCTVLEFSILFGGIPEISVLWSELGSAPFCGVSRVLNCKEDGLSDGDLKGN